MKKINVSKTYFFQNKFFAKLFMVMKITVFLLLFTVGSAFAKSTYSQNTRLSLHLENATLQQVFDEIQKKSEFIIFYKDNQVDVNHRSNVDLDDVTVNQILDQALISTELGYKIIDRQIVILADKSKESPVNAKSGINLGQQKKEISGTVKDSKGQTLPGVGVIVKGTTIGTITNIDGKFTLLVPIDVKTISFSFIGMKTVEVDINGQTNIDVVLQQSLVSLDDVVVIGYGSQNRKDITSSISTIPLDDAKSMPTVVTADAMIGKVSGLQVLQPSGKPGTDFTILVRGMSSLTGNARPLFVIDGVISSSLNNLDINNIESISVLKDAAAAGIYGAAGSTNGVILIKTKEGQKGKTIFEFNSTTGIQAIQKYLPTLNTTELQALNSDIANNAGFTSPTIPSSMLSNNNDWQKLVYRNAAVSAINFSASGGGDNGNYFIGLGYVGQQGIVLTSDYNKYNLKMSAEQKLNNWFSVGSDMNFCRSISHDVPDNQNGRFGGLVSAALIAPEYGPIKDINGYYASIPLSSGVLNPLGDIWLKQTKINNNNLFGNVHAQINLPFSLNFKTRLGAELNNGATSYFEDPTLTTTAASINGEGGYSTFSGIQLSWDNILNFNKKIEANSIDFILGSSYLQNNAVSSVQVARNFVSGITQLIGASQNVTNTTSSDAWKTMSYFARAQYDYDRKYMATVSIREDGSSRFGTDNKWAIFPTFSLGWRLNSEKFLKDVKEINDLKLRTSWGITGNTPTNSYPSYSLLSLGNNYTFDGSSLNNGVILSSLAGNPNLKWESTRQFNLGVDASLINNRIGFTLDYYIKKTYDLIYPLTLPLTTGQASKYVNLPNANIQNSGIEFSLNAKVIKSKKINWSSNLNFSFIHNVVRNLSDQDVVYSGLVPVVNQTVSITKTGYALGSFYGYVDQGVDPATGNLKFKDLNGDKIIDNNDRTVIGNPFPKCYYGFTNDFSYNNFFVSLLIDGVNGNSVFNATKLETTGMYDYSNQSTDVLKRWEKPGDITSVPKAIYGDPANNSRISSRYIENGSFLRFRTLSFGYNFPNELCNKIKIKGLRIYGTLQNILLITKYSGYSPDLNAGGSSTTVQGLDMGTYPQSRSYIIGLNLQL